jgi:hypothetical protein
MEYATIRPCKGSAAFVVELKKPLKLDLMKTGERLKQSRQKNPGIEVLATTPFILALRVKGIDVSLYPSGKMLVKGTKLGKLNEIADYTLGAIA